MLVLVKQNEIDCNVFSDQRRHITIYHYIPVMKVE